ncbi:IS3 family transposase [Bacillus pumilus]|uniref:IS3 family transposase n=1 Tax=Bacillus pumilus TaxID=1408 RepID=UPI002280D0FE|nr:IS3 family transposase [Bacillus pumilus]MCY7540300.1 hypothetical protein [Bacillus pumilus]MEC3593857.1 hypothetical protein [Bacillus pumilus]
MGVEAVHELKSLYPLTWLVCIAKVSRSGYYKWRKNQRIRMERQLKEQILKEHIMAIHHSRPFYGYPRVTIALKKEGFHINQLNQKFKTSQYNQLYVTDISV